MILWYIREFTLKQTKIQEDLAQWAVGMREICPHNFGNNDRAKELRIIPEF